MGGGTGGGSLDETLSLFLLRIISLLWDLLEALEVHSLDMLSFDVASLDVYAF